MPQSIFQPDRSMSHAEIKKENIVNTRAEARVSQQTASPLGKRPSFKSMNMETSEYLAANRKQKIYSARTSELAERKLISNMSNRVKIFWKGYNYTYPFTFKQCRLERTKDKSNPLLLIERHQYNFKRVNPNQNLMDRDGKKGKK